MPFLSDINHDDKVPHVLARFNTGTGRPLIEYYEALLRGDSPFTVQERELMAAYVCGVNACGAHTAAAVEFGVSAQLIGDLVDDPQSAAADAKLKPALAFLRSERHATTRRSKSAWMTS